MDRMACTEPQCLYKGDLYLPYTFFTRTVFARFKFLYSVQINCILLSNGQYLSSQVTNFSHVLRMQLSV